MDVAAWNPYSSLGPRMVFQPHPYIAGYSQLIIGVHVRCHKGVKLRTRPSVLYSTRVS